MWLPPSDARRRLVAAVISLAVVAAACGGERSAGVGITELSSDIAFGSATSDEPTPGPANFNPSPVTPSQAISSEDLPDQFFAPVQRQNRFRPPVAPIENPCPEAAVDEFPDETAPIWGPDEHKALPREGLYRWQRSGTLKSADTAGREIAVSGFERRLVRNVEVIEETVAEDGTRTAAKFTFETVQPEISGSNTIITTFQVRTNARSAAVFNPSRGDDEVTAGEAERGLVIKRIETIDREGGQVSLFQPAVGLLLLPIRVRPGEDFTSTAVDPRSRQQLQIRGQVMNRERVDACGEIIEGWRVKSTLTSTGGGANFSRDYSYLVATQYGAILLDEQIEQSGVDDELKLLFEIGQQDPDPLPQQEATP